jgi:hypothetical protein
VEYECQLMPIDKAVLDAKGFHRPLCDTCANPDCSNPIRVTTISIMGIPTKMRVWTLHRLARIVIECKGYVSDKGDAPTEFDGTTFRSRYAML